MSHSTKYKQHSDAFRQLLLIKGYRSGFRGSLDDSPGQAVGALDAVLRLMESKLTSGASQGKLLTLTTNIAYTQIEVKLIAQYDPIKGFAVQQQHISHNAQRPDVLHLRVNHEILGSNAILARNPRPRTRYDELLKGRPQRRSK